MSKYFKKFLQKINIYGATIIISLYQNFYLGGFRNYHSHYRTLENLTYALAVSADLTAVNHMIDLVIFTGLTVVFNCRFNHRVIFSLF